MSQPHTYYSFLARPFSSVRPPAVRLSINDKQQHTIRVDGNSCSRHDSCALSRTCFVHDSDEHSADHNDNKTCSPRGPLKQRIPQNPTTYMLSNAWLEDLSREFCYNCDSLQSLNMQRHEFAVVLADIENPCTMHSAFFDLPDPIQID